MIIIEMSRVMADTPTSPPHCLRRLTLMRANAFEEDGRRFVGGVLRNHFAAKARIA
jgi:hypothetical protein